jgi:transcription elongation factor Elf1
MNYDKLPTRGKETSDGVKTKKHGITCGGRCYVFYDEDREYHVECENCGTIVTYRTTSLDRAIKIWNDIPDIVGMF